MSDDIELERIKRQRLVEMQKSLAKKQEVKPKTFNSEEILRKIFVGRAWEVYSAARQQYPTVADQIFRELAMLVQSGRLRGQITGEQLFGLLRQIGLDVRLDTKIQVMEHGELKSLGDKFRGS
ncbi:MAG TPA: DNA-binding protein [Candidatus Bathyarchaeia archaeon]|nr:DNA-binding protein [Candidatus Bathyarchaeia archaeon]